MLCGLNKEHLFYAESSKGERLKCSDLGNVASPSSSEGMSVTAGSGNPSEGIYRVNGRRRI